MVTLPGLETYSEDQWNKARRLSPAIAHYERLLLRSDIGALHARRHRNWSECAMATFFGSAGTAEEKIQAFKDNGIGVAQRPIDVVGLIQKVLR